MKLFMYGTAFVACLFVMVSMGQLIYQHLRAREAIWKDIYFWLACFGFMVSLGLGEWAAMRVSQVARGVVVYAQDPSLALFIAVTLILAMNAAMRAVAIQHPVRGRWYLLLCGGWGIFCFMKEMI